MLRFYRVKRPTELADWLAKRLIDQLNNGRVLWLIPGGSAMDIAILAAQKISSAKLTNITVSLTDERYGPPGHKDSNWQQLLKNGFYLPGAKLLPVLNGNSLDTTASNYSVKLNSALASVDYSLALAGMGSDGHIFGIKPNSPAFSSPKDVVGYEWDDYSRLTPTINFIQKLSEVVLYVAGPEKHQALDQLSEDRPVTEQPAQLLKKLNNVTIFNDYKGEEL
jgi:6-phosphogluconolactonase/glucosamine-6-phosphate isomerase/deaminase